jgi:flagellar hook-length control protein FliK
MDMATVPTANSTAAASSTAGKAQSVDTAGKLLDASNGGESFTQVLGGQMVQEVSVNEPTDTAITLAGLMQMLQSLTMPIQNVLQTQGTVNEEQQLPEMLLQAMNSNSVLADKLLEDPKLKQWFQQAQEILTALSGKDTTAPLHVSQSLQSTGDTSNLQAQNTLLALTSMLKEQPNNVILQHITQDLQKVIQPLLPKLASILNSTSADLKHAEESASLDAVENPVQVLLSQSASVKATGMFAVHNPQSTVKHQDSEANLSDVVVVQPVKSQLEILAAKNAVSGAMLATSTVSDEELVLTPELKVEAATTTSPTLQPTEMLKAPLQTETALKAASQTVNANNFAQEMTEHVLKNMKITLENGFSEAKLSLFPKNLGHVDVKIILHEGQLIAQFAADTLAGKQMLESQLPQLRQSLQSQGLQVEKLEVTQNSNMQSGMFQDQRNGQQANQNLRQNKGKSANYDLEAIDFAQELTGLNQVKSMANGNSFDATA